MPIAVSDDESEVSSSSYPGAYVRDDVVFHRSMAMEAHAVRAALSRQFDRNLVLSCSVILPQPCGVVDGVWGLNAEPAPTASPSADTPNERHASAAANDADLCELERVLDAAHVGSLHSFDPNEWIDDDSDAGDDEEEQFSLEVVD